MNNCIIHVLIASLLAFALGACQPSSDTPKRTIPKPKSKTATAEPAVSSSQAKRADTVGVDRYANQSDGNEPWRDEYIRHLRAQAKFCIDNHDASRSELNKQQVREYCECSIESIIEHGDLAAFRQAELDRDMAYLSMKMDEFVDPCHEQASNH